MKKILFIHQHFPGQFKDIADKLSKGFDVESMSYIKKSLDIVVFGGGVFLFIVFRIDQWCRVT